MANEIYRNALLQNCPYPPEVINDVLLYCRNAFTASCWSHGVDYYRLVLFLAKKFGVSYHEGEPVQDIEKRILFKLFGNESDYSF